MKFELHVHATANHNGLKTNILCTCVWFNSMCSKLEEIFKHICLKPMTQLIKDGVTWHFNSKKFKKWEKHETLFYLMSCHQDDVVKNWPIWRKFGHTPLTNRSNSLEGSWFREETMPIWWRTGDSFLLRPSNFFFYV